MAFGLEGKGQRLGDRWRSGFGYKKTICVWGVTVAMVRLPASAKDRIMSMLASWDEYESRSILHGSRCDIIQPVSFMAVQCPERAGGEVLF